MRRGAKPTKAKVETKRPVARKSRKNEGSNDRQLETPLQEALKREAEALEQQTATSEILRLISSSPTDVQPIFETIAQRAKRLCDARECAVFRFDGALIHLVALADTTADWAQALRRAFPRPPGRGSMTARAILTCSVVHVPDSLADPEFDLVEAARASSIRSVLSVPMLRDGKVVGAITVDRYQPEPFLEKQIELVKTFADQAVIAIENVRLFTELQEKNQALTQAHAQVTETLEQQTATSQILRVLSSSPTDVQPVFDTIVRSALRLCNGATAAVFRVDGGMLHHPANHGGSPEALAAARARYPRPVSMDSIPGIAILTRSEYEVPDTEDPSAVEMSRETGRILGIRSLFAVPMLREGEAVGAIVVTRREPGRFAAPVVSLLKTFADQAVIAIENVRLFKELEARNHDLTEALEQQTATGEILRVISSSPTDVEPVFETILASVTRLCEASFSVLWLWDGEALIPAAHANVSPKIAEHLRTSRAHPRRGGSPIALTALELSVIHVPDVLDDPRFSPADSPSYQLDGARSILSVPMLREGSLVGVINTWRREPRAFTDKQISLLKTFADQAVIAIENVRLFTELQEKNRALTAAHAQVTEALEQQTATSEILRVISRSPTDVQPVFDTIVRNAVRLCGAVHGGVYRFDGELVHSVAHEGYTPAELEAWRETWPRPVAASSAACEAIRTRSVVRIGNIETDPRLSTMTPETQANLRARGSLSILTVPMVRQSEVIGAISLAHGQVNGFLDSHEELLKTFADQAVIAIENVRLFKELEERTGELTQSVEKLTALGEVSRAVSSTLDVETVLETIVSRASQLAGAAGCSIYEYDLATEQFELRATHNDDTEFVQALRTVPLRKGEGLMGRAAELREPMQIPDITQPGAYESGIRDTLIRFGYRALLAVPLLREDQIIGSLSFNRKAPGEFPPEIIEVLKTFATQSALAIQNARLFREIADKSRQLEVASQHKSEFLANMSHELRTPLNAIIGFSEVLSERMFGELNEKQDEYLKDIHASGQHLLSLINDILDLSKIEAGRMELEVGEFDLPAAIDNALTLVRERAGRRGIALHQAVDERLGAIRADERKLKQVLLNLLSNAIKFTPEGGRIEVEAVPVDGAVEVSVRDTGVGIAPEDQEAVFEEFRQVGTADKKVEGTGLGLALSRKFVELHGGRIWVTSQVGVGSTFAFTLPLTIGP